MLCYCYTIQYLTSHSIYFKNKMTKYSLLTLCFLLISFATFAQDDSMETGSTSSENTTIIPSEEGETIFYKGLSFDNPLDPISDYQITYTGKSVKFSFNGSDYCDCEVGQKEITNTTGNYFLETGICKGNFESGKIGMYIKNELGYTLISYYDKNGEVTSSKLLALNEDDLNDFAKDDLFQLTEMTRFIRAWYLKE